MNFHWKETCSQGEELRVDSRPVAPLVSSPFKPTQTWRSAPQVEVKGATRHQRLASTTFITCARLHTSALLVRSQVCEVTGESEVRNLTDRPSVTLWTPHSWTSLRTVQKDLLPPTGQPQELHGHVVALYADLDRPLWTMPFPLQQADAFLRAASQRTNHSSAPDLRGHQLSGKSFSITQFFKQNHILRLSLSNILNMTNPYKNFIKNYYIYPANNFCLNCFIITRLFFNYYKIFVNTFPPCTHPAGVRPLRSTWVELHSPCWTALGLEPGRRTRGHRVAELYGGGGERSSCYNNNITVTSCEILKVHNKWSFLNQRQNLSVRNQRPNLSHDKTMSYSYRLLWTRLLTKPRPTFSPRSGSRWPIRAGLYQEGGLKETGAQTKCLRQRLKRGAVWGTEH